MISQDEQQLRENALKVLDDLVIEYIVHDHPPIFTVEDGKRYDNKINARGAKNLFLRNQKGDKHWLVIMDALSRADIKKISNQLGESKLSFASPERLMKYLGLTPGSVSPMGLIKDKNKEVIVLLDKDLMKSDRIHFHPNINTASVEVSIQDFRKFLNHQGNNVVEIEIQ